MRNERFQLAVMNNTEPRASDVAAFENDLRKHQVRLLLYNSQASDAAAQRMVRIAQQAKVPVVGVTETEPAGTTFQDWMTGELNAVSDAALTMAASEPPFWLLCRVTVHLPKRFRSKFLGALRICFAALAGTASIDGGEFGCGPPGQRRAIAGVDWRNHRRHCRADPARRARRRSPQAAPRPDSALTELGP